MLCVEVNNDDLNENYGENLKMKRIYPMHCLFLSNVADVKDAIQA